MPTADKDREVWLGERMHGIGASEAPLLWLDDGTCKPPGERSLYQLWAQKRGEVAADDLLDNELVQWGIRLEPLIAVAVAEDVGRDVEVPAHRLYIHRTMSFLRCSPDRFIPDANGKRAPLQIKHVTWNADDWRNGVPIHVQIQLQHEMMVLEADHGLAAALVNGVLVTSWVQRNDRFLTAHVHRCQEFWRCVTEDTPPEVDGSEATRRTLLSLYPRHTPHRAVALPPEADTWTAELENIRESQKKLAQREDQLKNQIRACLQDAEMGLLPDGSGWTHRENCRGVRVLKRKERKG